MGGRGAEDRGWREERAVGVGKGAGGRKSWEGSRRWGGRGRVMRDYRKKKDVAK